MVRKSDLAVKQGGDGRGAIGQIVLVSFGDLAVPVEKMTDHWERSGMPETWMPEIPTPLEAFQTACSDENAHIWDALSASNADMIEQWTRLYGGKVSIRYITLPTKGKKGEYILEQRVWVTAGEGEEKRITPQHPNIARLVFNKDADKVDVVAFPEFQGDPLLLNVEGVINEEYEYQKVIVSGRRHTRVLREVIMEDLNAVSLMGKGGVWFVPEDGREELDKFYIYLTEVAAQYKLTKFPTDMIGHNVYLDKDIQRRVAEDVRLEIEDRWEKLNDDLFKLLNRDVADERRRAEIEAMEAKDEADAARIAKMFEELDRRKDRVEAMIERKREEVQRMGRKIEDYEKLLVTKIKVERVSRTIPEGADGRAKMLADAVWKEAIEVIT